MGPDAFALALLHLIVLSVGARLPAVASLCRRASSVWAKIGHLYTFVIICVYLEKRTLRLIAHGNYHPD